MSKKIRTNYLKGPRWVKIDGAAGIGNPCQRRAEFEVVFAYHPLSASPSKILALTQNNAPPYPPGVPMDVCQFAKPTRSIESFGIKVHR